MVSEKILERIKKLILHERSARAIGSIDEAQAFAAKIQALLDENKLGMSDVEFDQREQDEPIEWLHVGKEDFEFGSRKHWQVKLARTIAECNGCRMILEGGFRARYSKYHYYAGNQFWFVGRTSDREVCKVLFLYLAKLATHIEEIAQEQERGVQKFKYVCQLEEWEDFCLPGWRKWMKDWKDSWFAGFTEAVCRRMNAQHSRATQEAKKVNPNAVVRVEQELAEINESLKGKTVDAGSGRMGGLNVDGFKRGKRSGEAVNLSPNTFEGARGRASRLLA